MIVKTEAATDAAYWSRRAWFEAHAAGAGAQPVPVDYLDEEHAVWAAVVPALHERWERLAVPEVLDAARSVELPHDRVPQLDEVTERLTSTGFRFEAVAGLVPVDTFFGALADRRFLSTQYLRHPSSPLYTEEPDVVHEVVGHGTLLADSGLASLHVAAGEAILRCDEPAARQFVADVFWFSVEFGVVRASDGTTRAWGAGVLSSVAELDHLERVTVRPIDIDEMGGQAYRIDQVQPVLFGAESLTHAIDVVGTFFEAATNENVLRRLQAQRPSAVA